MEDKEELVSSAILAEQAERYEDMAKYMKSLAELGGEISNDERNVLSIAYKNIVGERRNAWRIISSIEKSYEESDFRKKTANGYLSEIASEQKTICEEVLCLLDDVLIPNATTKEPKIFYLKMKGDYYRYLAEVKYEDSLREKEVEEAQNAYEEAYALCNDQIPPINPIRLGLALNYSVFHYEILNKPEKACELASNAFDLAIQSHDMDESNPLDENHRDAMLILQLLRDNLTLWTSEVETDENETLANLEDEQ
jgi:14-3-3 protein beta/theta/zeta